MRYITTALVVVMVVLAGCNTGGTGGTPTAETTGTEAGTTTENGTTTEMSTPNSEMSTPADATGGDDTGGDDATGGDDTTVDDTPQSGVDASEVPGFQGSQLTNSSALLLAYYESVLTGYTEFETTYEGNGEATAVSVDRFTFQLRNDTQQQLFVENFSNRQQTTYVDGAKAAVRNETTGEIRYSNESNFVGQGAAYLAATYTRFTLNFLYPVDWEATGTTTVDNEEHYVIEPTGLNETRLPAVPVSAENVTSVDGRLVVGTDGVVHTGNVQLEGAADISVTYSLRTDDSIDVTAPDWYDESQHN